MKEKNIISGEYFKLLAQSIEKIGASLVSILHFTDKLVPEELIKFGLNYSISDLCQQLRKSHSIVINYKHIGFTGRINEPDEVNAYIIINALLSFILSQSKPDFIDLEIQYTSEMFYIETIDNGTEFNVSGIDMAGIQKLARLKSIIEELNGNLSFKRIQNNNQTNITFKLIKTDSI